MDTEADERRELINAEITEEEIVIVREETETQNCFQWLCFIIRNITLEPCIFLYFMGVAMEGPMLTTIILDKTCLIKLNYSSEICANLSYYREEQIAVERETNHIGLYCSIIRNVPTILFVLFLGTWSDKHGRKIPLIMPFIGSVLSSAIMWLNILYSNLPPEYILFSVVPTALTGGMTCLIMAMYSFLSDITTSRSRTTRIGFFDTFLMMGPTCGLLLSNVCKEQLGFSGTYIITGVLYSICIIYIIIRIEETRGWASVMDLDQELQPKSRTRLKDLFDCQNVKATFVTTFERRANYGRIKIILLMTTICLMVMEFSSLGIEFLYTELKLKWTFEQYTHWAVATLTFQFLGLSIFFPILSYKMGIRDEFLAIAGAFASIGFNLFKAFANQGYQMFIASAIGTLKGVPIIISRSMTSKIVPGDDSGKVFSVLGSWESFIPLVAAPLYTLTYNASISVFPGSFLIVNAALFLLSSVIYAILYYLNNRTRNMLVFEVIFED